MSIFATVATALIQPVANVFAKRIERRQAKDAIKGKAQLTKIEGEHKVELTDAEWEVVKAQSEKESWKDEWVTIVMTSPVALIMVGSLVAGFGYGNAMVEGAVAGITTLNAVGIPMPELMSATVLAALSLKVWRA